MPLCSNSPGSPLALLLPLGDLSVVCLPSPAEVPRVLQGTPPVVGGPRTGSLSQSPRHTMSLAVTFILPLLYQHLCSVGWG